MKPFPFFPRYYWFRILRVILGLTMAAHGLSRIFEKGISLFGEFLSTQGFPEGVLLAWGITIFEITGGIALMFAFSKREICAAFIFELLMAILLVHLPNDLFVAGNSSGGIQYNSLLIFCFLLIASED